MVDTTDRYPSNPGNPGAALEERLRRIEQEMRAMQGRNPLNNAVFQGTMRNVDDLGNTIGSWGPAGLALAAGAFSVDDAPVRALDVAIEQAGVLNQSLTTTEQAFAPVVLDVPDWATSAAVVGWTVVQMSNGSGAAQLMQYRVDIDGNPGSGVWSQLCQPGSVDNASDMQATTISAPGATITVESAVSVNVGTNTTNAIRTMAMAVFLR